MRNGKSLGRHQPLDHKHTRRRKRPNVLVIFGDEVGQSNISAYTHGLVGYRTPNIDRIAHEGILFTDHYGEQSGTGGRAAFVTGQSVFRSGLSKVSQPGETLGMRAADPTIADLLKPLGYATGQFGTNHVAGQDEDLPTMHGFDEFFGDFPKSKASGPLTEQHLQTGDGDLLVEAQVWITQQSQAETPWFCWVNTPPMHRSAHGTSEGPYRDAMIDHDRQVGALLDLLNELDVAEDTIVVYTTANGPLVNADTNGASTPFRSERDKIFEGAFRVPAMIRWPGRIKAGSISNDIVSHLDLLPTIVAAAGDPQIKVNLLRGHTAGGKTFRVHLDGYDLVPYLTGKETKCPRQDFFYFSDGGDLVAMRHQDWKLVFSEQHSGILEAWTDLLLTPLFALPVSSASVPPLVQSSLPKLLNLRTDPYERAGVASNIHYDWMSDAASLLAPMRARLTELRASYRESSTHTTPTSLTVNRVLDTLNLLRAHSPQESHRLFLAPTPR